jgi:hypothetical protein
MQGIALTKLDVLDGLTDPEDLRRLRASTASVVEAICRPA